MLGFSNNLTNKNAIFNFFSVYEEGIHPNILILFTPLGYDNQKTKLIFSTNAPPLATLGMADKTVN